MRSIYSANSILLISSAHPFIHIGLKEQYKLENGNYVCPTPIEEAIDMSRFISQVVVTGDNRPYNIALVVPDWTAIRHELDPPFQANHGAYFTSLPSWQKVCSSLILF